jgi:mRNA interferase YafQ
MRKLSLKLSSRIKKDIMACKLRGYDMSLFMDLVENYLLYFPEKKLPNKYKLHPLKGIYKDCWDVHITPDWVLIFRIDADQLKLILVRTGTHSDLKL